MSRATDLEDLRRQIAADEKRCRKGKHETLTPVFASPTLGGLSAWRCACAAACVFLGCSSPALPVPVDAAPEVAPYIAPEPGMVLPPGDAATAPFVPCGPPWCVTPHRGHEEA